MVRVGRDWARTRTDEEDRDSSLFVSSSNLVFRRWKEAGFVVDLDAPAAAGDDVRSSTAAAAALLLLLHSTTDSH